MKHLIRMLIAAVAACALATAPQAADAVKIGVIYPLTGNAASAGNSAKDAVDLGAEIVNGMHPELKGSGLAGADGLPKLGGAKIELINADHQGNPQVSQSQTLRLIQQEKVAAMLGAYHSSVALAATAVACLALTACVKTTGGSVAMTTEPGAPITTSSVTTTPRPARMRSTSAQANAGTRDTVTRRG